MSFIAETIPVHLPTFDAAELQKGDRLGQGEFGVVHQISAIQLQRNAKQGATGKLEKVEEGDSRMDEKKNSAGVDDDSRYSFDSMQRVSSTESFQSIKGQLILDAQNDDEITDFYSRRTIEFNEDDVRSQMQRRCVRQGKARYAIKTLRQGTVMKYRKEKRVLDALAIEAQFLSVIEHPNIIKMRGVASVDQMSPEYFIVLDRLYETLDNKLRVEWKVAHDDCKPSMFKKRDDGSQIKWTCLWIERLVCAIDLSSALKYLHKHK